MNLFKSSARLEKRCKTLELHVDKLKDERERLEDSNFELRKELKGLK